MLTAFAPFAHHSKYLAGLLSTLASSSDFKAEFDDVAKYFTTFNTHIKEPIAAIMVKNLCTSDERVEEAIEIIERMQKSKKGGENE